MVPMECGNSLHPPWFRWMFNMNGVSPPGQGLRSKAEGLRSKVLQETQQDQIFSSRGWASEIR